VRTETDPVSETLCFVQNTRQQTNSRNPVILAYLFIIKNKHSKLESKFMLQHNYYNIQIMRLQFMDLHIAVENSDYIFLINRLKFCIIVSLVGLLRSPHEK
jgi:hypothetical protein